MKKNKKRIDETLEKYKNEKIKVSLRSLICHKFSEFIPYDEKTEKLIYNSQLIDGVKFKLKYVNLTFNARHFKIK